ncbi:MAG: sulfane dehydrogenase subunit SoxC [Candidatus Azotimanducaceae bacterium]|jgi:sulfane dehydrogenase subunit SoxC
MTHRTVDRRGFLKAGTAVVAGTLVVPLLADDGTSATSLGAPMGDYGQPSPFAPARREGIGAHPQGPGAGASSTPLQLLNGTVTPNSLHFERHHSGIPQIDPGMHTLTIYGDVHQPLRFSYEDLLAYPLETHMYFLECSGNSYRNTLPDAQDATAGALNGLVSGAEWTGVPLHYLLAEAGIKPRAKWLVAEGADASANTRSVPLNIALDNVMVALYQNGEPLRPSQGFPMRLFVPGCEGNVSIKWLTAIKLQAEPAYTREETSKYTDLLEDGRAEMFSLRMAVKSLITTPSGRMTLPRQGVVEISGLAWSGHGSISKVEVSADAGRSWVTAQLQSEPGPLRLTRFRLPWRWQGAPAILQSRALDDQGHLQPSRDAALARYSPMGFYHYNGIQSWQVNAAGEVKNVYV